MKERDRHIALYIMAFAVGLPLGLLLGLAMIKYVEHFR